MDGGMERELVFLGACYPRCIVIVISNVMCLEGYKSNKRRAKYRVEAAQEGRKAAGRCGGGVEGVRGRARMLWLTTAVS